MEKCQVENRWGQSFGFRWAEIGKIGITVKSEQANDWFVHILKCAIQYQIDSTENKQWMMRQSKCHYFKSQMHVSQIKASIIIVVMVLKAFANEWWKISKALKY